MVTATITADQVTLSNSYHFADNYSIYRKNDQIGDCFGCEHNKEHADAIARYLSGNTEHIYYVVKNPVDAVRVAKQLRNGSTFHVKHRDFILEQMGL
jgi:hypothetical protein